MTVEELKHILFNLETIKELHEQSKRVIGAIDYEMEGVKGIRFDREPSKMTIDRQSRLIELIEKKEKVNLKQEYYSNMIKEVKSFISSLDGREKRIIMSKFMHKKAIYEIADECEINTRTVYRIINDSIRNYCDKEEEC